MLFIVWLVSILVVLCIFGLWACYVHCVVYATAIHHLIRMFSTCRTASAPRLFKIVNSSLLLTSVYFCSYSCFCVSCRANLEHSVLVAAFANRSSLVAPLSASKLHYRHFSVCFVTELMRPAYLAPWTSCLPYHDFVAAVLVIFRVSTFLLASRLLSSDLRMQLSSRDQQDLLLLHRHCHHHRHHRRCHRRLRRPRLSLPWMVL